MSDTTIVYARPNVTVFLPGGVHGFHSSMGVGVPMPAAHAEALLATGHVATADQLAKEAAAKKADAAARQADDAAKAADAAAA